MSDIRLPSKSRRSAAGLKSWNQAQRWGEDKDRQVDTMIDALVEMKRQIQNPVQGGTGSLGRPGLGNISGPAGTVSDGVLIAWDGSSGTRVKSGAAQASGAVAFSGTTVAVGDLPVWAATDGLSIKDAGSKTPPAGTIVGTSDTQTLTNKTLTTPTIGSFANATHTHADAAGGGQVAYGALTSRYFSKSIAIEDPSDSEDISMFFTERALTITEMRAVLIGSSTPSVTWTVRHSTDRSAVGAEVVTSGTTTTSTTSGSDVTSFNDATIPADSFVWVETTAQSGTVDELHITLIGTED